MTKTAAILPIPGSSAPANPQEKVKTISWPVFQKKYLTREDLHKYEWVNRQVEKSPASMDKTQLFLLRNLMNYFGQLRHEGKLAGQLISEADLFFKENHRRPDICWLTDEQIDRLADNSYEVPAFVIEVVSNNDAVNYLVQKMQDYRAAGVAVVWHVFPKFEEVHVYSGAHLEHMKVCTGDMRCSAGPALPVFEPSVQEVFKKKA